MEIKTTRISLTCTFSW